jgi:hypothetical protein
MQRRTEQLLCVSILVLGQVPDDAITHAGIVYDDRGRAPPNCRRVIPAACRPRTPLRRRAP